MRVTVLNVNNYANDISLNTY